MATEIGNLRTRLSFEKTGDSNLTELTRDLKGIRSEMTNFRASGRAYRTSLKGMKDESDILSRRLQVQRERVSELMRRYEESKRVNGENATATKDLAAQYNNAQAQMKHTEQQLSRLNEMIRVQESRWTRLGDSMIKTGDKMKQIGDGLTSFGRSYTMRVTTPILAAGVAALKVGMDFEEGMSKVEAVSGATGDELESLKEMAKELGETTKFSATEAAEGLYYMGLAGWETQQMLDGLPGVLDLAAASGEDLGRTSDIVTDGLSAFKMEAKESSRFADVLAAASANANTDVSGLGAAFQYVAPVAGALGFTIEDTALAIGLMSDNGIKGQKAGTALRTMMTNLAKPTAAMQKEMEKLNISLTDSEGNMKTFDEIMVDLRKSFSGLTEEQQASAAATIFGKEAMSGALAIIGTTERDYDKLAKSIAESEGAASEMAKVMQDNAKGAMTEFKSALEGAGIAAAEHLIPAVTDLTRNATDLIRKFGELDDEQQKQIIRWAGAAAAIGPAAIALGGVATTAGNVLTVGGKVAKMLGSASGAGLVGRLGLLGGPAGVAVIAAAGLGLLAYKMIDANKEGGKLYKISTDVADGMYEQADSLELLVTEYDELNRKSKLTTDELGRMLDIQRDLEQTQNPGRIAELQEEYAELAAKSGLTNEELDKLLGLNNDIIEQSPHVEKSFTDKGSAIVESTDAVKGHIQALREMAYEELLIERDKSLMNEIELRNRIKAQTEEILELESKMSELVEYRNMPLEKAEERLREIDDLLNSQMLTQEEYNQLTAEQDMLLQVQHGTIVDTYNALADQRTELMKKRDLNEQELAQLDSINERIAEVLLAQVDINYEQGKGLDQLDTTIDKLKEERDEILKNLTEEQKRNGVHRDKIEELDNAISKHEQVRDKIKEEVGYQSASRRELEMQNSYISAQDSLLAGITKQHSHNNNKIDDGTKKAKEQNEELGKKVDKQVNIKSSPSTSEFERRLTSSVSKRIDLITNNPTLNIPMRAYAKGTKGHPGGPFIAGEEGWEIGRMGNRMEILNFGMYDRPKGYEVVPHNESKRLLNAMNNIPKYANGTGKSGGMLDAISNGASLLQATLEQNKLLAALLEKDTTIAIDGKTVARQIASPMQHELGSRKYAQTKARRR